MNNKYYYFIILSITVVIALLFWIMSSSYSKIVSPSDDTKDISTIQKEHFHVKVHKDTLIHLCHHYKGLGAVSFSAEQDTLRCNITISTSEPKTKVVNNLFEPEVNEWSQLIKDDVIKLDAEILPNHDTIALCPVIFLYHLVQNFERKLPETYVN